MATDVTITTINLTTTAANTTITNGTTPLNITAANEVSSSQSINNVYNNNTLNIDGGTISNLDGVGTDTKTYGAVTINNAVPDAAVTITNDSDNVNNITVAGGATSSTTFASEFAGNVTVNGSSVADSITLKDKPNTATCTVNGDEGDDTIGYTATANPTSATIINGEAGQD